MATKKPCPGCGNVHPKRQADSVCHECQRKIASYDNVVAVVAGWKTPNMRNLTYDRNYRVPDEMKDAIRAFLDSFPSENGRPMVPATVEDALQAFGVAINNYGEYRYKLGHKAGSNLLARLAAGDLSTTDFDHHRAAAQRD